MILLLCKWLQYDQEERGARTVSAPAPSTGVEDGSSTKPSCLTEEVEEDGTDSAEVGLKDGYYFSKQGRILTLSCSSR